MALASDLFFSTDTSSETLHRRITPTDEQFEDQKTRWNDLAGFLRERLKEDTELPTRTWLQGSYKFDTQIRPWRPGAEFDIDLGFYFEWPGKPSEGDYKPKDLKALIQAALKDYQSDSDNDATSVDPPKERCCRIKFHPDFHIDVPCYHLDGARDERALATETKGWEESDPKAIYEWFKKQFDDPSNRAQLRRLVRYLKMWAALKFQEDGRPSSIMLTVLAAQSLQDVQIEGVPDDELLEQASMAIKQRLDLDHSVPNPVASDEDLNRLTYAQTIDFLEKLGRLQKIAGRANSALDRAGAAEIWSEAFDQFFPMPEDNPEQIVEKADNRNAIILYQFDPQIKVVAKARQNAAHQWTGVNELPPIPKDCNMTFTLVNAHELPAGAQLRWTVRNRGDEANDTNDLGHVSAAREQVTEHSAYNGEHAMDLAVYLGTQVIGRRRIKVKVRGAPIPPRNKPRRRYN